MWVGIAGQSTPGDEASLATECYDEGTITAADIESLCGRPAAFEQFATELLGTLPDYRPGSTQTHRRHGWANVDRESRTAWWVWPWPPDHELDPHLPALGLQRNGQRIEFRVLLTRMPRDPARWAERIAAALRTQTGHSDIRVHVHGPTELARWCSGAEHAITLDHFRLPRAFAARTHVDSACERALIDALDRGDHATEHWMVVADELLRRGDPTGESLALALASGVELPSRQRALRKAFVDQEAARMAHAGRDERMLAFVDKHGRSFDAVSLIADPDEQPQPERYEVQLWAQRVGPFFVRLLARTNYDEWRGVGLPEALLCAPELRYLSPARMSSIHPDCADVSGRDLSRFDFSSLPAVGGIVHAYEASLRGCDLRQAVLSRWQLDGADLREAEADLDTRFSEASFVDARVSLELKRLLESWNGGRYRSRRDRSRSPALLHRLVVA